VLVQNGTYQVFITGLAQFCQALSTDVEMGIWVIYYLLITIYDNATE